MYIYNIHVYPLFTPSSSFSLQKIPGVQNRPKIACEFLLEFWYMAAVDHVDEGIAQRCLENPHGQTHNTPGKFMEPENDGENDGETWWAFKFQFQYVSHGF